MAMTNEILAKLKILITASEYVILFGFLKFVNPNSCQNYTTKSENLPLVNFE